MSESDRTGKRVKYFDVSSMRASRVTSVKSEWLYIDGAILEEIEHGKKFPLISALIYPDRIRCTVHVSDDPVIAISFDVPVKMFVKLPTVSVTA